MFMLSGNVTITAVWFIGNVPTNFSETPEYQISWKYILNDQDLCIEQLDKI